ncbi:hypothetical protein [Tsukamurella sp. 1534]|uniref:hypothetical protein n=1 Tax=Tsukamurella sp. 1534 TaxID=1151061 RepID=UPI0003005A62|nr:hypothetical protein [Tsukamurella sp. 1534]
MRRWRRGRILTATARDRLRDRQGEVLADLLAGRIPDGFDADAAALTSRVLFLKRSGAAARAFPPLRGVPEWPAPFFGYAAEHAKEDCSARDARDFLAWLHAHGDAGQRAWVRLEAVRSGARRCAWVSGRPVVRVAGRVLGEPRFG